MVWNSAKIDTGLVVHDIMNIYIMSTMMYVWQAALPHKPRLPGRPLVSDLG
jgi:hypothetical protein